MHLPPRTRRPPRSPEIAALAARGDRVAYFCAEFGLSEMLPIYSGGLGVLAGDHLKSSSDLAVPLVGVGLFYREGFFRQALTADARQKESYPIVDPLDLPVEVLPTPAGVSPIVTVRIGDRDVHLLRPAREGGADPAASSSTRTCREPARGPRDHEPPLRRGPGHARAPGARPRDRRHARPRGRRAEADGAPRERGARGVPRPGEDPPAARRARPDVRRGARDRDGAGTSSRRIRRCRRGSTSSRGTS